MSKRIAYYAYGSPDVLRAEDERPGAPGPGQVRLRQEMIGVNPVDWKMVAGYFRQTDRAPFPHVPGWASAGIIEQVGPRVAGLSVGDAVIAGAHGGAYREQLVIDARLVVPRPEAVSIEQAAALPSSAVAGYSLVQNLRITDEDTLLVHGAAGSVGAATVQIALDQGARVIGTASARNHNYLRSLGAIPVLYGDALASALRRLGPITASADAVGGRESVDATRAVLVEGGRAVTAWGDEHSRAADIPWVRHPDDELEQTVAIAARGALTVRIGETFPLESAADALELSHTGHPAGKILLAP
ncbi:NADP-dependent oxidoreductase [Rhodococcus sp. IEGM 1409]|uniref:NADP-dependent oxidoreductase n=1 Tax=Rhodococcus sp. IEGM 1409 TaxID=3047082 RepID=UPI0024B77EA6|nr:NADP-dependent oxidoreductase [Rhodococcus sp. IEGM 1409]MDI9900331.1 NADP-dependent oxidoreductase [Rhodococcus sp. IEGM 1409]